MLNDGYTLFSKRKKEFFFPKRKKTSRPPPPQPPFPHPHPPNPPKSPVFNFRSRRVSFAEEDDLDRDVVSVLKGRRVSQSVSPCYVDHLLQKCKKGHSQKKKKLTSLASKTAPAPSSPPLIDPHPRPPTHSSLDASRRSRPPRQRISGWRGAGRCSSYPLPVSALSVHRSGPERSASPWKVGAGVLVPGCAFRASGRRARRLGRW